MDSPHTAKMPYRRLWVCSVGCHIRPSPMPTTKPRMTSQYRRIKTWLIVIELICLFAHGVGYEEYRRAVPMLIPGRKRLAASAAVLAGGSLWRRSGP
jgi:hypothetical protein